MPSRGASAWQEWRFLYEQPRLVGGTLRLSIPHARNFVICLKIVST